MITVNVTERDIQIAEDNRSSEVAITERCPVALAFKRVTKDRNAFWAYNEGEANGEGFMAVESDKISAWVHDWDARVKVLPIKFLAKPN